MKKILFVLSLFVLASCVDEVSLPLRDPSPQLVVEGLISNDPVPYEVKLSYTGVFSSGRFLPIRLIVNGALVTISDDRGNTTTLEQDFLDPGTYRTTDPSFVGVVGRSYTLTVITPDEKKFVSKPERLVAVPPISRVYAEFAERTLSRPDGYEIYIDTQDPADAQNYYRWTAYGFSNRPCGQPYLWVPFFNRGINIFSDDNINGKQIARRNVLFSPMYGSGFHFIEVAQYAMSREAYQFWQLYNEQLSRTGSILDPLPAPIKGNISNAANPDDIALGYFQASGIARRKLKITPDSKFSQAYVTDRAQLFVKDVRGLCDNAQESQPRGWE
jgi:Domain of unknown function (DUF4249)